MSFYHQASTHLSFNRNVFEVQKELIYFGLNMVTRVVIFGLDYCRNLREKNSKGIDPFLLAIICRSESMIEALKNLSNIDHCDANGQSFVHIAAEKDFPEVLQASWPPDQSAFLFIN